MLILASASPRRRDLLTQVGLKFQVDPADIDEGLLPEELAAHYVLRIAEEKARAVFVKYEHEDAVVLAADTCVLLDGCILGKPRDRAQAHGMLQSLSGRTHQVLTGVSVVSRMGADAAVESTLVTFNPIDPRDLEQYLDSGDPLDKAGAYGIQGYAARWIPRIEGCYFNVMGLPLARTLELIRRQGVA